MACYNCGRSNFYVSAKLMKFYARIILALIALSSFSPHVPGQKFAADLVVINANIHTMDANRTIAQSIAVSGGKIIAVGTNADTKSLIGPNTRVIDANGKLTDDTKKVIDLIAEADIILAGGHLPASELHILFDEAARRGVKKMMVNHPTYIVGCNDTDIRQLVSLGVKMEHSICMFIEGKSLKYSPDDLAHLIEVAGVDNTILSSDLGLQGSQRPVDGFRSITQILLDLQMPRPAIRKLISDNAARFLNLPVSQSAAQDAA